MILTDLFNKPFIGAVIGDVNEAKSNTIYYILQELKKTGSFNLFTYGLKNDVEGSIKINSIDELERIKDSVIILDEVMSLWDLDNRMAKRQIENTLRLIHHNNNILLISAVPSNIKKFISNKITLMIYKKVTFGDFINGSSIKRNVLNYKGIERGSSLLNLEKNEAIVFDGEHYTKIHIPYLKKFDSKRDNVEIVKKTVNETINRSVNKKE